MRPPITTGGRSYGRGPTTQPTGSQSVGSQTAGSQRHVANSEPVENREEVAHVPVQRGVRILHPARQNGAKWFKNNTEVSTCVGKIGADLEELSDEISAEMSVETPFAKALRLVNKGLRVMTDAVRASDAEIQDAESRAEAAEREAARLQEEFDANTRRAQRMAESEIARVREEHEANSRRAVEFTEMRVRHARKAGKRQVAAEMMSRREQFESQFMGVADAQRINSVFREQRGIVGGLHFTQDVGYSYDAVFAKQSLRLAKLEKKKANLPVLEAKMWDQWNPIVVSPDSVEVGPEIPDAGGEVDQLRADANAGQYP